MNPNLDMDSLQTSRETLKKIVGPADARLSCAGVVGMQMQSEMKTA